MPFQISIKVEKDHVIVKNMGLIDGYDELKALDKEKIELIVEKNKYLVIDDVTELQFSPKAINITDIAQLVEFYVDNLPAQFKKFKVVTVLNKLLKDVVPKAHFWETYARNRGYNIRVVYTMEDALKLVQDK